MARHIRITCPHCRRSGLRLRPEYLGSRVLCKHCGEEFVTTAEDATDEGDSRPTDPPRRPDSSAAGGPDASPRGGGPAPPSDDARIELERLRERVRDLEERLGTAVEAARRRDAELADAGRRTDELRGELERLASELPALRAEGDGLAAELSAVRGRAGALECDLDAANAALREADARQTRLEFEADGFLARAEESRLAHEAARRHADELSGRLAEAERSRAEAAAEAERSRAEAAAAREAAAREAALRARLEEETAGGRDEARRSARALEEARGRADGLREEVDRLLRDREADRAGFEAALQALRQELDQSRSREASGRDEAPAPAPADALAGLRRRLDEAAATVHDPGDDDPAGMLEDLARQLSESRRSNQRLCSLLDVFGLPKEHAAGRSATAAQPDADQMPSSRPSRLPG